MIVVSDTSPLVVLSKIEMLLVLPGLFGTVLIPREVAEELEAGNESISGGRVTFDELPWIRVVDVANPLTTTELGKGEAAALALAQELGAKVLIDEKIGRNVAASLGLFYTGTVGVLEQAAAKGLLNLEEAFIRLKATDFRISHAFLDAALKAFRKSQAGSQ